MHSWTYGNSFRVHCINTLVELKQLTAHKGNVRENSTRHEKKESYKRIWFFALVWPRNKNECTGNTSSSAKTKSIIQAHFAHQSSDCSEWTFIFISCCILQIHSRATIPVQTHTHSPKLVNLALVVYVLARVYILNTIEIVSILLYNKLNDSQVYQKLSMFVRVCQLCGAYNKSPLECYNISVLSH